MRDCVNSYTKTGQPTTRVHNTTANAPDATVRDREAARTVSCSMEGAGAWLRRLPDPSVRASVVHSTAFLIELQRHFGLYLTAPSPPPSIDAAAAMGRVKYLVPVPVRVWYQVQVPSIW